MGFLFIVKLWYFDLQFLLKIIRTHIATPQLAINLVLQLIEIDSSIHKELEIVLVAVLQHLPHFLYRLEALLCMEQLLADLVQHDGDLDQFGEFSLGDLAALSVEESFSHLLGK